MIYCIIQVPFNNKYLSIRIFIDHSMIYYTLCSVSIPQSGQSFFIVISSRTYCCHHYSFTIATKVILIIQPQQSNINHAQRPLHNLSQTSALQWIPSCIYEWQCFLCYSCSVLKDQWGSIFNSYCQSWLHKDTSWMFFGLITQLLTVTSTVYTSVHPQWLQSNSAKQLQSECKTQTGINN